MIPNIVRIILLTILKIAVGIFLGMSYYIVVMDVIWEHILYYISSYVDDLLEFMYVSASAVIAATLFFFVRHMKLISVIFFIASIVIPIVVAAQYRLCCMPPDDLFDL